MADDTSAALIAQLDVKFDQLASNMKKAMTVFDNGGRALENRQAKIKKNLSNWALDFTGLSGLNKALVGLTAVGVVGGLVELVKKSLEAASAIGDTAIQAGTSVEKLQQLRYAATQSGASMADLDAGLVTLNRNMGEFINTGGGRAAAAFKQLGFTRQQIADIGDSGVMLEMIAEKSKKFGTEAQKSSLYAKTMGMEAGPKLKQMMEEGQAGIDKLAAQADSLGIVLTTKTVKAAKEADDKLSSLATVIKSQVVGAVSQLAPQIAQLADAIKDSLPNLITLVEKWGDFLDLIKLSPVQKMQVQLSDLQDQLKGIDDQTSQANSAKGSKWNFLGWMNLNIAATLDNLKGQRKEVVAQIKGLQDDIAKALKNQPATTPPPKPKGGKLPPTADEVAAAKAAEQLRLSQADALAQTGVDAKTAAAALTAAQDQLSVQLLKGSADYYAAIQKQINDEYTTKVTVAKAESDKQTAELGKRGKDWKGYADGVANIESALTAKIAAAGEDQKRALDEAGPSAFIRAALIQGDAQIKQYKDETAALGLTAGAMAELAFIQNAENDAIAHGLPKEAAYTKEMLDRAHAIGAAAQNAQDAATSQDRLNSLNQSVEQGFLSVGTAALHGFGSMKAAAADALNQIADLIIQLYVLQPILDSLKNSGGSGGLLGGIGNLISSIPGFASGTNFAPGGMAIVGERGPELVNLPRGSQVIPSVPKIAASGISGATVIQQFDLRGAMVDKDVWATVNQIASAHATSAGKQAVSTALKPHVLGPAMDQAKMARGARAF